MADRDRPLRTAAANKEVFRRLGERGPVTRHRIGPPTGNPCGQGLRNGAPSGRPGRTQTVQSWRHRPGVTIVYRNGPMSRPPVR